MNNFLMCLPCLTVEITVIAVDLKNIREKQINSLEFFLESFYTGGLLRIYTYSHKKIAQAGLLVLTLL